MGEINSEECKNEIKHFFKEDKKFNNRVVTVFSGVAILLLMVMSDELHLQDGVVFCSMLFSLICFFIVFTGQLINNEMAMGAICCSKENDEPEKTENTIKKVFKIATGLLILFFVGLIAMLYTFTSNIYAEKCGSSGENGQVKSYVMYHKNYYKNHGDFEGIKKHGDKKFREEGRKEHGPKRVSEKK